MSLYIDRLSHDARVHFGWACREAGTDVSSPAKEEDSLIEFAKRTGRMESSTDRVDLFIRSFGEAEAPEAIAVIQAIHADLDRDAEVAGDPETVEVQEWKPQGDGKSIADVIEGLDATVRIDGHHDVVVSAHTTSWIRIGARAVIGDGTYQIVEHLAVVAQTGETYDDAGHALALAQDLIRRTTGYGPERLSS